MEINSNFLGDDLNSHHSSGAGKVKHFSEVLKKLMWKQLWRQVSFTGKNCPLRQRKNTCGMKG